MKCKYCNNEINDDSLFCPKCGSDLRDSITGVATQTDEWYYAEGENYIGPISSASLNELFEKKVITSDTYVWKEGMTDWIEYQKSEAFLNNQSKNCYHDHSITENDGSNWYYFSEDNVIGPFSEEKIVELYLKGVITPETNICKQGYDEWILFKNSGFIDVINSLDDDVGEVSKITKEHLNDWYYNDDFTLQGPYSEEKLIELYNENKIDDATIIWRTGDSNRLAFKNSKLYERADHIRHNALKKLHTSQKNKTKPASTTQNTKKQSNSKVTIILMCLVVGLVGLLVIGIRTVFEDDSSESNMSQVEHDYHSDEEENNSYTIIYTDGVPDDVVFNNRSYMSTSSEDVTHHFSPEREGYVFQYWQKSVVESDPYTITYTAVWEKWVDPDAGTYVTNYRMSIRSGPNRNTTRLREIPQGSTVNIIEVERNSDGNWGKISDSEWICLSDSSYIYCSKQ